MRRITKYYEDAWFKVEYTIKEDSFDFEARKIITLDEGNLLESSEIEDELYISGTLKLEQEDFATFKHQGGYIRYYGLHEAEQYHLLWKQIYLFKWELIKEDLTVKIESKEVNYTPRPTKPFKSSSESSPRDDLDIEYSHWADIKA